MVSVSPKRLTGPWKAGFALDLHTTSADFLGYNEFGHPEFDYKYTEIGGLLNRLKYRSDKTVVQTIVETAADFVRRRTWTLDVIVPIPPSRPREFQPVLAMAESLARELGVRYCDDCVVKVRETPELKSIFELEKRQSLLQDAFKVSKAVSGKRVLLFDDLYRSGATAATVARALQAAGVVDLYLLTVTMTRTRR